MSSYIITGSADNKELAKCEYISNQAKLSVNIIIKHPNQWEDHLNKVCRVYGFVKKENPLIYRNDGKLIGSSSNFYSFIEQNFSIDTKEYDEQQRNERINLQICEEKLASEDKIKRGNQTLIEKIEQKFLNSSFGEGRQIIDQELEFIVKEEFDIHIQIPLLFEKKVEQSQTPEPIWIPEESIKLEQTLPEEPQVAEQQQEEQQQEQYNSNRKPPEIDFKLQETKRQKDFFLQQQFPQVIPILEINKENIIEKLSNKWYLAQHPESLIPGHCFILNSNSTASSKEKQNKNLKNKFFTNISQIIMYRKNFSNIKNVQNQYEKQQINIFEPFTLNFLQKVQTLFSKEDGLIVFQLLPAESHNFINNQSNLYHYVPSSFLKNKQDQFFKQNLMEFQYQSIKDRIITKIEIKVEQIEGQEMEQQFEEKIELKYGKERTFYKNRNYSFVHIIHKIQENDNQRKIIRDMILCLRDYYSFNTEKSGYNIILTNQIIFIAPLDKPYYVHDKIEVFNPIFLFIGQVHLPRFQILKPYESVPYPTIQTIRPIKDLILKSQK